MKKTLQELHTENNKYPDHPLFYITYAYDKKNKEFKFIGYHCTKCGKVLKQKNSVPRHQQNCRLINTNPKHRHDDITEDTKILNKNGDVWQKTYIDTQTHKKQ